MEWWAKLNEIGFGCMFSRQLKLFLHNPEGILGKDFTTKMEVLMSLQFYATNCGTETKHTSEMSRLVSVLRHFQLGVRKLTIN